MNIYGFGDRYYVCTKCDSNKLTPKPSGGFSPPTWYCKNCGETGTKSMSPERYKEYLEEKELKRQTKKYNI